MNMKRMRGRNHRPNNGGGGGATGGGFRNQQNGIPLNRNHVFDSSGPEMRVRGTAQQLFEKYTQMARDASSNGDRVTGEAYYQHAEHYFRIISAINQAQGQPNGQPIGQPVAANGTAPAYQTGERPAYQNGGDRQYNNQNQGNGEYRSQAPGNEAEAPREEFRQQEPRQDREPRRFEPRQERQDRPERQYEPRNTERKPEFQPRPARTDNGFRNEPSADQRIDISSALDAELAASQPAGFGEQPALPMAEPAVEARAIPIIPDAPPAVAATDAPIRRPRGRPRLIKETPPASDTPG